MFNSENSKFKAGDSVVLKNSQYRGGWLEHNLAGGREVEYTGDTSFYPPKTTVTRVLKRKENSINGVREEYYYEVSGYPGGRFREDLLEGEGSGGSCIEYGAGFYISEALEVSCKTNVKYFTEEDVQEFEPDVFTRDSFNSEDFFKSVERCEGTAIVSVAGIWYDNETVELELYFVFEGEPSKHRVMAKGPADAVSLSRFKFHAREVVGQMWGEPSLSLAKSGDGYFALDMFCDSLEILAVEEIDTDDWD